MFHVKCVCWKNFEQIDIDMAYLHVFLITIDEMDIAAELYLEPLQRYVLERFYGKS